MLVLRYDFLLGNERVIYSTENGITHIALSSDTNYLALIEDINNNLQDSQMLVLVNTSDLSVTELWKTDHHFSEDCAVNWLHNNSQMLVSHVDTDSSQQQLYLLDIESGTRKKLGSPRNLKTDRMVGIRVHPTENRLVYGNWRTLTNIWAVENY